MAAPNVDIASQVAPMTSRISSEPLLLAAVVVVVTASLAMVASWIVYKLLTKRDEAFKTLAVEFNTLSTCITKVTEVQTLDHASTIRNRDLLQDLTISLTKLESKMTSSCQDMRKMAEDLRQHAKECSERLRKELL